ncbi:MAG: 30S ribosomal protein S13, partial [Lentisphaeria bacterium]|nr:30S ribosomal protein S13 [Lentisphaeria bacterium]
MPRIQSNEIPANKRMEIALTYITGIGRTSATNICNKLNISVDMKS